MKKYLLLLIVFASCNTSHDYTYIEHTTDQDKAPEIIKASDDLKAYTEAYQKYCIAKKVNQEMREALGSISTMTIGFEILNDKGEDISTKVDPAKKDSIEKELSTRISGLHTGLKESFEKAKQEKEKDIDIKLKDCPVQILSAKPVEKEYSNYKDIRLSWKNVSNKTISAIRFRWKGINAFGEPADMGATKGEGAGFTDDKLRPGKTDYGEWSILSRDLKKVTKAWAYEIAFEDGTKWTLEDERKVFLNNSN